MKPEPLTVSPVPTVCLSDGRPVKLGRIRPLAILEVGNYRLTVNADLTVTLTARVERFFNLRAQSTPPPPFTQWYKKAGGSLGRMYVNDREGCCVISSKFHNVGVWSSNDATDIQGTDQEVHNQYVGICGPNDQGCIITRVLDVMARQGLTVAGKQHTIDSYASFDHKNKDLTKTCIQAFAGGCIGINLPRAWTTTNAVWDLPRDWYQAEVVGGHDVAIVDYQDVPDPSRFEGNTGVVCSTWGGLVLITWPAWNDARFIEESYCYFGPDWYNADGLTPSGFDVSGLKNALDVVKSGRIPDLPPVTPPVVPPVTPPDPPPTPATYPPYDVRVSGPVGLFGREAVLTGTAVPRSSGGILGNPQPCGNALYGAAPRPADPWLDPRWQVALEAALKAFLQALMGR